MTQYLISLGHRRIAFLSDTPRLHFVSARLEGYRQALRDAGINPNDRWVSYVGHRSEEVTAALEPMARSTAIDRPTAWFCNGDSIAGTALRVCERSGIRVPQDLSITGFNDDNGAKDSHPPLTTIRQPYDQIGEAAVELLLARIDDPTGVGQHFVLPTELIVRGSSGPPP